MWQALLGPIAGLGKTFLEGRQKKAELKGKLEEAKIKFNECLDINPEDKTAIAELAYIKQLENKIIIN